MKKTVLATLVGLAAFGMSQVASAAIEEGQLTIWVNGDKAYDGIAKVGKKFEQATGVKVTVAHPDQVEIKFQQTAATGNGLISSCGLTTVLVNGLRLVFLPQSNQVLKKRLSSRT